MDEGGFRLVGQCVLEAVQAFLATAKIALALDEGQSAVASVEQHSRGNETVIIVRAAYEVDLVRRTHVADANDRNILKVIYQMVADPQVLLLKNPQGEIDMMDQYIGTPANKPVLYDGQERGDYHLYTLKQSAANAMVFQLNLNHVDPVKNELFNNRDFRVAISHGIDRQALIDGVFVGQGSPAQPSIREGDPLYNETLAKQHTEYDPDKANEILDGIIPERDSEGFRLDREGRRVTVIFEIDHARKTFLDMFELALPMF